MLATYLHVNFVTAQDNGDVFADALEVTMPIGHVLICDPGCDIKHDDAALALDVVAISQSTELLLPSGIPNVEADGAEVGGEGERVNLHSEGS